MASSSSKRASCGSPSSRAVVKATQRAKELMFEK